MSEKLKIIVTGLRGVPDIQGGIETHAQNLYPVIAQAGHDVEICARQAFVPNTKPYEWKGLHVTPGWSPKTTSLEAIGHTVLSTLRSALKRPDILHIHGVGPALAAPLARLLGMPVIVTHHGRTYESDKWGTVAKLMLRYGEAFSMRFAQRVICVANYDANRLNKKYKTDKAVAIPNGMPAMAREGDASLLDELGVQPGKYVLHVGRIVPEKRQLDLIAAFTKSTMPGWKLVLVGSAMHASQFADDVEQAVAANPSIVAAGHRQGQELSTLYGGAGLFVLPSALEGFSISILEALGFGLPVMLSDIPGNREFQLPDDTYFNVGDVDTLAIRMTEFASQLPGRDSINSLDIERLPKRFRWDSIGHKTIAVMQSVKGA